MSNVKVRRGSKSITSEAGSNSRNSDLIPPTAKRSAKPATTKNPPPWLKKAGGAKEEDAPSKEAADVRFTNVREARKAPEERKEEGRKEVLRRRVDELSKAGATFSKSFGRP